ncbi:MAG: N-formylglutamate amidohydrolase, partial [Solirubrobacterales bacterium]|nr:N-formylglutamate amidohydrolase [Solirubrobacterales bacterium]
FEQRFFEGDRLTVAFESAQVTYGEEPVDLYNSGVNQILSVAATRGHRLLHFSMVDLNEGADGPVADMSVLELGDGWQDDPIHAHRQLRVAGREQVALAEVQLFVMRADDVRTPEDTPNLELLRRGTVHARTLETVEATLSTTDKYAPVEREPQLPHPVTFAASSLEEALAAIDLLPHADPWFVLKDRHGYGCGAQVHRLAFDDPRLSEQVTEYLEDYGHLLLQEFCAEVAEGDIVVTFFDDELIGALRRLPAEGEWKTNASTGAAEIGYNLTPEQESIARTLKRSFPECRLASVDLLPSGRIIEINAFPGGEGLLRNYGISLGEIVMDRMERELLGPRTEEVAPAALTWERRTALGFPTGTHWQEVDAIYDAHPDERDVYDVFSGDRYRMGMRDLIEFIPRSPEYILSIPHSGVFVPEEHRDRFSLGEDALVEIDLYSDLCYEMAEGMHLRAELAPFFVDMNRTRAGADDGELPRHLTNAAFDYYNVRDRPMLRRPYSAEEERGVLAYYDVYHDLLNGLIERMRRERGYALVFDCHSMTSVGLGRVEDEGEERSSFVVGTLEGSSAHAGIIEAFTATLTEEIGGHGLGLDVATDAPYSGGFITRAHHDPDAHIHVLQLEIAMDSYMHEVMEEGPKRYAIKRPRLRIVRRAVQAAFRAAAEEAERVYHQEAGVRSKAPEYIPPA